MRNIFISILTLIFLFSSSVPSVCEIEGFDMEELKQQIKEELREEMRQEMRKELRGIVKDEVRRYVAGEGDTGNIIYSKSIRELLDEELDSYAAGETELEVFMPGGKKQIERAPSGDASIEYGGEELRDIDEIVAGREKVIERALVQKGGMLLGKGKLQIEPSFTTAHFSSNRINIQGFSILPVLVIGQISTQTVKRDLFIETLSAKYGIFRNFQGQISIPWRHEFDRITDSMGVSDESTRSDEGLGDISVGISRQIAWERGIIPDMVANLVVKSKTGKSIYNREIGLGTGHYAIQGSITAVKSNDPAVVFGNLGYTWNIERDIDNFAKVNPGNSISYSIGMALALNYQTAINFSFSHSVTEKMSINGQTVSGSFVNTASLKNGFTWTLSEKASIDFSVSLGLTTDAPDYTVEVRFPYYF